VRFPLVNPVRAEKLGLYTRDDWGRAEPIFGALIRLTGPDDVPDSTNPLDTPDVLATALITPPAGPSPADVAVPIQPTPLDPGYYALLFGSGQFGATGSALTYGGYPVDDIPNLDISYFYWFGDDYRELGNNGGAIGPMRAILEGEPLPEPGAAAIVLVLGSLASPRPHRARAR
jgi:hypothetical protein